METSDRRAVSRRAVAKGAAWAVPAIAVAASTPAFAASQLPPVHLDGWMEATRDNVRTGIFPSIYRCRHQANACGTGSGVRFGMYITQADGHTIGQAQITWHFAEPMTVKKLSPRGCNTDGWSTPTATTPPQDEQGYYTYTSTYTGGYTQCPSPYGDELCLVGRPAFEFRTVREDWDGCRTGSYYDYSSITRSVMVDGEWVSFIRTLNHATGRTFIGRPPIGPDGAGRSARVQSNPGLKELNLAEGEKGPEVVPAEGERAY